jgi:hypothetical protein
MTSGDSDQVRRWIAEFEADGEQAVRDSMNFKGGLSLAQSRNSRRPGNGSPTKKGCTKKSLWLASDTRRLP